MSGLCEQNRFGRVGVLGAGLFVDWSTDPEGCLRGVVGEMSAAAHWLPRGPSKRPLAP
jgi:hypothetical protein